MIISCNISLYRDTQVAIYRYVQVVYRYISSVYMHVYGKYACMCTYRHVFVSTYLCLYIVSMCVCVCVCVHACVCVCVHVCVCACVCVCVQMPLCRHTLFNTRHLTRAQMPELSTHKETQQQTITLKGDIIDSLQILAKQINECL